MTESFASPRISVAISDFDVTDVPPGTKHRLWLEVFLGLLETVRLPALVVRGARPGPALLGVAGVHGDEYEGMEALRIVFTCLDPEQMAGTFLAIPVCNPFA